MQQLILILYCQKYHSIHLNKFSIAFQRIISFSPATDMTFPQTPFPSAPYPTTGLAHVQMTRDKC